VKLQRHSVAQLFEVEHDFQGRPKAAKVDGLQNALRIAIRAKDVG
jgi:hypothetical protein